MSSIALSQGVEDAQLPPLQIAPTLFSLLLMSFLLIIGLTGCFKSDEKTFSGV